MQVNGFHFDKELVRVSKISTIPDKIKLWYRDLLNFNIKVPYRLDKY